jgi:hypothetical protein
MKRLDTVYAKARDFIRDNPKARLDVKEMAEALEVDVRDLEVLIAQKRLDRDADDAMSEVEDEEIRRKKLLESLQRSSSELSGELKKGYRSYGEERYGKR